MIAWKNPKENAIERDCRVYIFFCEIPAPTATANASAETDNAKRSTVKKDIYNMY